MIQYALKCTNGHKFDSWFQSASAFEKLKAAGMVTCSVCGHSDVEKAIMTPRVRPARAAASPPPEPTDRDTKGAHGTQGAQGAQGALTTAASPEEKAMSEMRRKVEENADYVGQDFVTQARAMHDGDAPERSIYGEARIDEARALLEDGIPVAPLPFMPSRKTN